ncbi:hypothetical protein PBY51_014956 [Eleginops maclovinus]|uniref:Uncharacterized protein n=1 Tax=Eleginops maclovinus TaxID=56733 RepID=A0AAN7X269_ELEMC|nr:hypothetical protein PBY51_014956 [Eleginops maclovinus]
MLYHGKLKRKSAIASGRSVLLLAWLRTEMDGWRMRDGGGSVRPQGALVEMMQGLRAKRWAMLHMEVHSYLRQRPAGPFVHFLYS